MFMRISFITSLITISLILHGIASAENWPSWRGPRHDGISTESNVPTKWSATENVAWKLPLPGEAGSTPAIWDDRIFLTTANGEDLELWCISTDGEKLWSQLLDTGDQKMRTDEGNLASPSPSTDGEHVWAMVGSGVIGCYDNDGNEVWKFNLQDRYGEFNIQFGMASTPVLDRGRLYVQLIHGDRKAETQEAVVVCIDAATGEGIWQHQRQSDAYDENKHSYASPTIYRDDEGEMLLTHGADYLIAHSLEDGSELWRCGGLNPQGANYHPTLRFVSSPVAVDNLIVIPTAKNGPTVGVRPHGEGDITNTSHVVWQYPNNTPDVPSPLVFDGLVYLCRENGNLQVLDAKTGEEIYQNRTVRDRHRASPVLADGKLYLTSRNGVITIVKTGREFKILEQNDIGEEMAASPVISNGTIYLRTFESLYAIREE